MGFYHPAVLLQDAQRHGLRVLPIDVNRSEWDCTVEAGQLRIGLRYVRGLRESSGRPIAELRPFQSVADLVKSVPTLHKDETEQLAFVGALNSIGAAHRREALWQVAHAIRPSGPLLEDMPEPLQTSPLDRMNIRERIVADYQVTSITIGRHPMAYRRADMKQLGVTAAVDLSRLRNGTAVKVAGSVIVRQRPGTAKGIVFVSLEDETGIASAVVMPDTFKTFREILVTEPYLLVEGTLQNVDGVIHVKAGRIRGLEAFAPNGTSHDFR